MAIYNGSNANNDAQNREIEFKLVEKLGVLDTHKSGWAREVNIVAWNGKPPKFDIRDWDMEHRLMKRGVTRRQDEMETLMDLMNKRGSDLATGGQVPDGQAPGGQVS